MLDGRAGLNVRAGHTQLRAVTGAETTHSGGRTFRSWRCSSTGVSSELGDVTTLIGVAAWIWALLLWWSNRRLGLDFLLEQRQPALA